MKIYVETPRTVVRGFTMDDAADMQEVFGDALVMANVEPPYDQEKTKKFLQSFYGILREEYDGKASF